MYPVALPRHRGNIYRGSMSEVVGAADRISFSREPGLPTPTASHVTRPVYYLSRQGGLAICPPKLWLRLVNFLMLAVLLFMAVVAAHEFVSLAVQRT